MEKSYSAQYHRLWKEHWWWQIRHQLVMEKTTQICQEWVRPKILDIGCGGGAAFDDLDRLGDVKGIEPNPDLVDEHCPWRNRICQTCFSADYQTDDRFDVVWMLDVLEHIENDLGALLRLNEILSPGGVALITVPALSTLWSQHDVANHHFRRYHRREFQDVLLAAGFEIEELRYVFGWSLGLMYLRRLLSRPTSTPYTVRIPFSPVNKLCYVLTRWEERLFGALGASPPIGSSLLAVIRRPDVLSLSTPRRIRAA